MSQQQHTQEPVAWRWKCALTGKWVFQEHPPFMGANFEESELYAFPPDAAARIAELEEYGRTRADEMLAATVRIAELEKQRDTLLAALRNLVPLQNLNEPVGRRSLEIIEAAIASVKSDHVPGVTKMIDHPLTSRKVTSVQERGYKITGYTLTNDQGQKCIVDMSAVRWFDDGSDFFRMMHPQPAHCAHTKADTIHTDDTEGGA